MAAVCSQSTSFASHNEPERDYTHGFILWPAEDSLRLLCLLQAASVAPMVAACSVLHRQLGGLVNLQHEAECDPGKHGQALEAQQALAGLELALSQAAPVSGTDGSRATASSSVTGTSRGPWQSALEELQGLESSLKTEMRYIYGPDWEVKPGKLMSKKGTWLKRATKFSWETSDFDKNYMPQGVMMPVLQLGRVTDPIELHRHDWSGQHLRVWLKPTIISALEARRMVWFIYLPHWEQDGSLIITKADTWLKRSCQLSGELQSFELIYVPKNLQVALAKPPEVVTEEWEKSRHAHVHQHRKVTLAALPMTAKQDNYDIFVGQAVTRDR